MTELSLSRGRPQPQTLRGLKTTASRPAASDLHHHPGAGAVLYCGAGGVHRLPHLCKLQDALQGWLVSSLVPDSISRQVLGYLTQFAAKASSLGRRVPAFCWPRRWRSS